MKLKLFLLLIVISQNCFCQLADISINSIPENLKENSNSIVREQKVNIVIESVSKMTVTEHKVISVINKQGLSKINAYEHFNKSTRIKNIEAIVYNASGVEIKKIKRKDFVDQSTAGDAADITDGRVLYLNFTPTEYPFTIIYKSEVETSNTAFIPSWFPIDNYEESIQKSEFTISYPSDLGFKYKELDFDDKIVVKKEELPNSLKFSIENNEASKYEELSSRKFPHVLFGLNKFTLEEVEGVGSSWKDFGKWMNDYLLKDTDELPLETVQKIKELTSKVNSPIEKAKIVYNYVQNKTRYVSIQLGIGGWKPILAKNVDRLGYGDCKALTNYTKSLLNAVGVTSYYTVIYGDSDKKDMIEDFVSMQGNHVILTIPNNEKYIFLECTSQTNPFGFQGNFTDDRLALVVKPEGGEIIKTNDYSNHQNSQITTGSIKIDNSGQLSGKVQLKFKGNQYVYASQDETLQSKEIEETLKERYSHLTNSFFSNFKVTNNKDDVEFTENFDFVVKDYTKVLNKENLIAVNVINQNTNIPKRYRTRKTGFEITHGFYDEDSIEIALPENKVISYKPEKVEIENKFGKYSQEIIVLTTNKIQYKRKLTINKGKYDAADYELYRQFREQISKNDASKLILN